MVTDTNVSVDSPDAIGKVTAVQGPVVDVKFERTEDVPVIFSIVKTKASDDREIVLEVSEHLPGNVARCIALNSTLDLKRSEPAYAMGTTVQIPEGEEFYERIVDMMGNPIDNGEPIKSSAKSFIPIRRQDISTRLYGRDDLYTEIEQIQTGIKMIDLLFPIIKGSKTGILGGAGMGSP